MISASHLSILFFLLLLFLGLGNRIFAVSGLVTGILDNWPIITHKKLFTFLLCLIMFILGLPMCSYVRFSNLYFLFRLNRYFIKSGTYIMNLMDQFAGSTISLSFICFLQTIFFGWVCGADCTLRGILLGSRYIQY